MIRRIKKVAVLGSGVMGSGIACHLANAGLEVLMLDIVPPNLDDAQKSNPILRNKMADSALATALKTKPAPLYDVSFASRITTGNFEDDMHRISECDWIIEVVVERLDIKRRVFEQVDALRKENTLVTSNTSGIPIHLLAAGRSDNFKQNFCGTHFFNPARYLPLLEIIPHSETDPEIVKFWMHYGAVYLGKNTVLCKDTPAFIANRIGFYSGNKIGELTEKYGFTIEEVDKITGDPIGWPSTGSFRLLDLVGLDTSVKVTHGVIESCPDDEYVKILKDRPTPKYTQFLLDNNFLGNKTGQGFYKKTETRDDQGKRIILALDLETLEYKPSQKSIIPVVGIAKKVEIMDKRINEMIASDEKSGYFVRDYLCGLFSYAANRVFEISDNIYSIDDAMKSGYAWSYGPFEYWDMIGLAEGAQLARSLGETLPAWVDAMIASGATSFYKSEGGKRKYYDLDTKAYQVIPGTEMHIHLDNYRENTPVYKNSECTIHDIGDGVLCFEFTSKSNAIGEGIGEGALEAIQLASQGDWAGIVIGNNAKNFTVGANLMSVGMYAMQKDFKKLNEMVDGFQQINMAMRYAPIPIVTATQGYVFGGGCEILMHTDAAVCHAESYIGLVEVGVGLIPGGGGTKEFALRASELFFEGDVQMPTLIDKFRTIATATVSTSAYEGFNHGYLKHDRDVVEINLAHVLSSAKAKVLQLAQNYTAPIPKQATVLGRAGIAALYTAINEFFLGKYMTEYDQEIARKLAYVICGGDLTGQRQVSEQYLLDIEREAFLQLLGNPKTLERIQYLLMNNKPLRN
ncbi:MAG: 3-hydroxyacyl-CoA dehydrogenase/enoyl-CoA hydratase family protein [Chitinophagales bacterium]|nr:3-hydroxyacyl-CoA dehydrogenase/enoyl-CoA hydratase family protein [Chitinophagales bacterium]